MQDNLNYRRKVEILVGFLKGIIMSSFIRRQLYYRYLQGFE